ncbi:MAG: type II toxin-antitoxin system PemK/MazF family toxin [Caldilineaceae bacterium]
MEKKHHKDFEGWHQLKAEMDAHENVPTFKNREIWWCSIGVNVGHEIDGKSRYYNRPILVIRKFNTRLFWGVPLTTRTKENPYYLPIDFTGSEQLHRSQCVMLSHLRLYDSKRLHDKMGRLPHEQFERVRKALRAML